MFEITEHLSDLRCRSTSWLVTRRAELVAEQRRLRTEELAVVRVLDERGAIDDSLAERDGISLRTVRETVETARALESLPEVAAAAHAGRFSGEQLGSVVALADESSDAEWARRGPQYAPADLARQVRTQRKPTVEDSRARREARCLRMWWRHDRGMLGFAGELPDLDGARFEATINQLIDRMRPAKGQPWDTREHRGADALLALCHQHHHAHGDRDRDDDAERDGKRGGRTASRPRPVLVVEVPLHGPALVAGIPLPDAMVESLRANAAIEPVLVDDDGLTITHGRRGTALSPKIVRSVLLRDGHCRWPGCERRTGLQIHHLTPRSRGGTDSLANLAAVCAGGGTDHHTQLVPHGHWTLTGNPNQPDGFTLTRHEHAHARTGPAGANLGTRAGPPTRGSADARAGPDAA